MARYSAEERAAIARGEFFTAAELRAHPGLGRGVKIDTLPGQLARDPNTLPVSAEARAVVAAGGVCAYCWEPGDERSALNGNAMHPECQEAWDAERAAR